MVLFAIASTLFNTPVLAGLLSIVFFASIGISLGVRRAYIKVLLTIFEVCIYLCDSTISSHRLLSIAALIFIVDICLTGQVIQHF